MELKIAGYLDTIGYKFQQEYTFPDLKDKFALRFDFAVTTEDGLVVVEYQGEQHYWPVRFSGISEDHAERMHLLTVKHDTMKREYCDKHGIKLVCISYIDKDIYQEILDISLKSSAA
jgi:hypothetical protein